MGVELEREPTTEEEGADTEEETGEELQPGIPEEEVEETTSISETFTDEPTMVPEIPGEAETTTLPTEIPTEYPEETIDEKDEWSESDGVMGDQSEEDGDDDDDEEEEGTPASEEEEEEPLDEDDDSEEEDEDEVSEVENRARESVKKYGNPIKAILRKLANRRRKLGSRARDFFGKWMKKGRQNAESREP